MDLELVTADTSPEGYPEERMEALTILLTTERTVLAVDQVR